MSELNKATVTIAGIEYTIVSERTPDQVKELGNYVDKKVEECKNTNHSLNKTMVFMLSAFNIADELFHMEENLEALKAEASEPMASFEPLKVENQRLITQSADYRHALDETRLKLAQAEAKAQGVQQKITAMENAARQQQSALDKRQHDIQHLQETIEKLQKERTAQAKELQELRKSLSNLDRGRRQS